MKIRKSLTEGVSNTTKIINYTKRNLDRFNQYDSYEEWLDELNIEGVFLIPARYCNDVENVTSEEAESYIKKLLSQGGLKQQLDAIKKLNESEDILADQQEFDQLFELVGRACAISGGDCDDGKGNITDSGCRIKFISYVKVEDVDEYRKKISTAINNVLKDTRFTKNIQVYVTKVPVDRLSTYIPVELVSTIKDGMVIFEVEVTAQDPSYYM